MSRADYLVVDSGGFIVNAPLRDLATNIVTLRAVVDEIRDKPTRQRLQVRHDIVKHVCRNYEMLFYKIPAKCDIYRQLRNFII